MISFMHTIGLTDKLYTEGSVVMLGETSVLGDNGADCDAGMNKQDEDSDAGVSSTDDGDVMPFPLPPPPAELLNQQDVAMTDSDDEFPLPPPPDVDDNLTVVHHRLAAVQRPGPQQRRMTAIEQPPQSTMSLLSQIRRGVPLRRAVSNDRSAPRIPHCVMHYDSAQNTH